MNYTPQRVAHDVGLLLVQCEDGKLDLSEILFVGNTLACDLHGDGLEGNIGLSESGVLFSETFIGTRRCKTIQIRNSTNYAVRFKWAMTVRR